MLVRNQVSQVINDRGEDLLYYMGQLSGCTVSAAVVQHDISQ